MCYIYISRSTALRLGDEFHRIMSVPQNSSLLLSVALLFMMPLLSSTRAAPVGCKNNSRESDKFKNCAELYKSGQTINGVYRIDPDGKGAFNVYCDQTTDGGGWTVFQKRQNGSVDFDQNWNRYKNGFGDFTQISEFWLGLEKIYRLTQSKNKLRVDLVVNDDKIVHVEYEWFRIGNETAKYRLHVGNISSKTTADSLRNHNGSFFSTLDRLAAENDCEQLSGGWWFIMKQNCVGSSNLNGIYLKDGNKQSIHWANLDSTADKNAPRATEMKIRPKEFRPSVS